ncbi:phospholipid scramblase 1-like, partial [Contarinia nasturtii]|uniref:phospholipid scramblase 1-like n=1 Tax=Contarinia nasturtii TaxID=265458 RepID=UPI0012D4A516
MFALSHTVAPGRIANSPPGLEYLTQVNQLLIKQQVDLRLGNRFVIKNAQNQNIIKQIFIYWAKEDANCLATFFLGSGRPFNMKILDNRHVEVLHLYCPAALGFTDSIEVSTSSGQIFGRIRQKYTLVYPNFKVKNHKNETILHIVGPAVKMRLGDVVIKVRSLNDREVGRISKRWSGLARESFTEADHFGISFPMDLDVRVIATLLGAVLLIGLVLVNEVEGTGRGLFRINTRRSSNSDDEDGTVLSRSQTTTSTTRMARNLGYDIHDTPSVIHSNSNLDSSAPSGSS